MSVLTSSSTSGGGAGRAVEIQKRAERTYLLCAFGELKHSGVGERAPASAVRCALPASPMPRPPSARRRMGDRVLAKSKKGDNEATCGS